MLYALKIFRIFCFGESKVLAKKNSGDINAYYPKYFRSIFSSILETGN